MGNNQDKFQYSHNIEYDIEFSHEDINLTIELRVEGSKGKKYYKQTFAYDELPLKLQEHFESSQKLYELFGKEDNFVVDPLNGMIYIRVKEEKSDTKIQFKVPLQLDFSQKLQKLSNKKQQSPKKFQNLNELIQQIPVLMRKEKKQQVVETDQEFKDEFDRKMKEFEADMKQWRETFLAKVKKINGEMRWQYDKWQGTYIGEISNRIPHGLGLFLFDNGQRIEGQWKQGIRHGKSIMYWKNGTVWESEWKKGKYHGKQIKHFNDGKRGQYEYKNGEKHGLIRIYDPNKNLLLEEIWVDGEKVKKLA